MRAPGSEAPGCGASRPTTATVLIHSTYPPPLQSSRLPLALYFAPPLVRAHSTGIPQCVSLEYVRCSDDTHGSLGPLSRHFF